MQKIILVIALAGAALLGGVVFYINHHTAEEEPPVQVMPAANDVVKVAFELDGLDGNKRSFSEWDGEHRIVNFWATWCAPCRREIPLLKAFQEQYGDDGFQVIGIAVEFPEPVVAYAEEAQFNYPILVGEQDAMAVAESSGIGFIGLPFTMIVARDGTLVGAHMGEIHQEQLNDVVNVLKQLDAGDLDVADARIALDLM